MDLIGRDISWDPIDLVSRASIISKWRWVLSLIISPGLAGQKRHSYSFSGLDLSQSYCIQMEITATNHIMFIIVYPKITIVKVYVTILDFEEAVSNSCMYW